MQRNRSQPHQGPSANTGGSNVVTRSRSASSRSSNTNSSSSGSSSSASSSSSSSSGSGSDSSSSDTEASRASSQASRTSRASRSSQKANVIPPNQKKVTKKTPPVKKQAIINNVGSSSTHNKSRTSGSVTNTKTIPSAKSSAAAKAFRRKNFVASSSESESSSAVPVQIKKAPTKPAITSTPSTKSVPPPSTNSSSKKKPVGTNSTSKNHVVNSATTVKKASSNNKVNSTAKSASKSSVVVASQRKSIKSIFSPDNSSEDSEDNTTANSSVKKPPASKKSTVATSSSTPTNPVSNTTKKKPSDKEKVKKRPSPAPVAPVKAVSSSSLSATSTASSSVSSSDSSSDSENKKATSPIPNPKSPTGSVKKVSPPSVPTARKRPVTRRQRSRTVKSKTIPTTTTFNPDSISLFDSIKNSIQTVGAKPKSCSSKKSPVMTFSVLSQSQPHASPWDSDFSDEPRSLIRVPAKSSQKIIRKPIDEDEEEHERKCPFPGCDSVGHLSGIFPSHCLLPTCPKYHGFSTEECKENAGERENREIERKKYYVPNQPHFKKPSKLSHEGKAWMGKLKEMKSKDTKDGLCSEYDMSLWNDALAVAAARIETEQGEGISHRSIAMGRYEMSCWCESPYAEPLCHCRRLFVCEFCLKPLQSGTVLRRHCAKCVWRHPPGDEIYRKDRLSVWEVDGKTQKTYCQNLCLLAKCFLDHKTLYLDVDPFLFYVMTLADSQGCHLVGYFSKEKNSFLNYNVSCILTLPPYQRQGFGRLLIDFSYLLTRVECKVGSPEKPLSDLGLISYRSYWKDAVLRRMCACASREMNVKDLSIELGVTSADLVSTLQFLGMLKYWKGKHLVLKKQDVLEEYLERVRRRGETRQIDSSCLRWRPFQPPPEPQS